MYRQLLMVFIACAFAIPAAGADCPVSLQSTPNAAAQKLAVSKLSDQMQCLPNELVNDKSPCNTFASRGLKSLYGVTDFIKADGEALAANAIAAFVATSGDWKALGPVFDEDNNLCAQALANNAYPVIAVMSAPGHGHIALAIPGEPKMSPLWKFNVANGASFLLDHPEKAFIGELISKAFRPDDAKKAQFYYRVAGVPGVTH